MENIYQQAIADAKALRASAMANAKAALQEAFEPKIEEMVRMKLSEELDEVEEVEETELEEADEMENEGMQGADSDYMEETELGESELEEILAELEALAETETADPSKQEDPGQLDEAKEDEEEDEVDDDAADVDAGEEGEAEETKEITVSLGDLKSVIDAIKGLSPELAGDEIADDEAVSDDAEEVSDEESISLDEILAQLEEEDSLEEKKHADDKEHSMEEGKDHKKEEMEEEKKHALEAELEEAKATIQSLQESFNEINLLNAKLLYMNKIFKAKTLTESQKIQVVKAFDKATSVKEVKNTFEVLKESVTQKKSQITESFGYASKPAGVSPKANVIDADPFVSRWQKLAGL